MAWEENPLPYPCHKRALVIDPLIGTSHVLAITLLDFLFCTIAPACADRSCGPPKPAGAAYENQPDGAAGRPSGPDEAPESAWGRRGMPRGSEHQSCTDMGQSSDPSDDYKPRAALEGTHFFLAENRHAPKIDLFFGFIVTRQTAMPIQIVPRFCARGYGRFQKLLYQCQNPSR